MLHRFSIVSQPSFDYQDEEEIIKTSETTPYFVTTSEATKAAATTSPHQTFQPPSAGTGEASINSSSTTTTLTYQGDISNDEKTKDETTTLTYEGDVDDVEEHLKKMMSKEMDLCQGHIDAIATIRHEVFVFKGEVMETGETKVSHLATILANLCKSIFISFTRFFPGIFLTFRKA